MIVEQPMTSAFCPGCLEPVEAEATSCHGCRLARPEGAWPRDPHLGRLIQGKYKIVEKLGEGGFGVVLRGRQIHGETDLGDVVLKLLHPSQAQSSSTRRRFVNEARLARTLVSPHVVKIYDFSYDEQGIPFLVMEFVDGVPLASAGRLPPGRVVQIGMQIATALEECHQKGIIHRDLKPDNVLLLGGEKGDFVKIIDFGIAHEQDAPLSTSLVGTPRYMAPEQIQQRELDGGVDIFALGVMLFECLADVPPIAAVTPFEYMRRNLEEPPAKLRDHCLGLPVTLEGLLDRMMAKERAARPASMSDVASRLEAIAVEAGWLGRTEVGVDGGVTTRSLEPSPGAQPGAPARRNARVLLLALALVAVAAGGVIVYRGMRTDRVAATGARSVRPDGRDSVAAKATAFEARRDAGLTHEHDQAAVSPLPSHRKPKKAGNRSVPQPKAEEDFPSEHGGL